jgi:hypothetical protein
VSPPLDAGLGGAVGGIDGPQQLFALPGRGDLVGGISSGKTGPQPYLSSLGELLGRGQQQHADQAAQPEGEGEIRQRRLIKEALRMRPDRLIWASSARRSASTC